MRGGLSIWIYLRIYHNNMVSTIGLGRLLPQRETFFLSYNTIRNRGLDPTPWNWQFLASLMTPVSVLFFVWSTEFLPELVSATLFETWPLLSVLLFQKMFGTAKIGFGENFRTIGLFSLIFIGVVLVVLSTSSGVGSSAGHSAVELVIGLSLMVASICFTAMGMAFPYRWVTDVCEWESHNRLVSSNADKRRVGYRMLADCARFSFIGILSLGAGILMSQTVEWGSVLFITVAGCIVLLFATMLNTIGTLKSLEDPKIQSIRYLTPVFGSLYVWLASYSEGVSIYVFSLGLTIIVAGNVWVNFLKKPVRRQPSIS